MRLAGIEGGIECAKLAPLLSALADDDASADQLDVLRRHMDTCLSLPGPPQVAAGRPAGG